MKKYILLLGISIISLFIMAQKPEPVYSFVRVLKPISWYKSQSEIWFNEINKDKQNASAWYNYYRANRSVFRLDTTDKRTRFEKGQAEKKIVDEMEKAVPESYEYNLCRWLIGGNNYEYLTFLKKASELGPDRTEHIPDMIVWGEIERNFERRNEYAKKWFESKEASPGLLYYNYNVISGLKTNAIILTCGDNDTYPIWMLQSQGIRKDVKVLNLSLLYVDAYRDKIFKELNIPKWEMNYKSLTLDTNGLATDTNYQKIIMNPFSDKMVEHIARNKNKFPVYIALTAGDEYTKLIAEKLYLTGLAYEYSNEPIDNMAELRRNFEQNYLLDHIDKHFYFDVSSEIALRSNCNYEVPMLKLYDHYKVSGENFKAAWIKEKILYIVKGRVEEQDINNYLNKN